MPQISHLRAYLEAAACGSFVEASERLNLSPTAVSARIRALENEIGARLFRRSKHGVELNKAGRNFLAFAETAVQAWDQGRHSVKAIAAGNVPILAGIQQDLWEIFAAAWFERLKLELPDVQLRLKSDYSDMLCERVAQGLLDCAVVFVPKRRRGIVLEPLAKLPVILAADRPWPWRGRLPDDYYHVDWGDDFTAWHDRHFGPDVPASLTVGVSGIALSAIRQNGGAAYFLAPTLEPLIAAGEMFAIEGAPGFAVDVFIARSEATGVAARLQPVLEAIRTVPLA